MAETIEISGLPAASTVTPTHELPTQKSGVTEKATVEQILSNANLSNISGIIQNSGLPSRLQSLSPNILNFDDAPTGWSYAAANTATNAPNTTNSFIIFTVAGNTSATAMQTAYWIGDGSNYRRFKSSSTWGAWSQLRDKVTDLNFNYQAAGSGTKYVDFMSVYLEEPAVQTYQLVQRVPIELKILQINCYCISGTATVRIGKNGTPMGTSTTSVNNSGTVTTDYTSNNTVTGDYQHLQLIVSAVSSCQRLTVTIKYERNLVLYA